MPLLKSYGQNPPSPTEPPRPTPSPMPSPTASEKTVELLRVLMVENTRQIIVEVDGVRYKNLQAVVSRTIGQRILESAAALLNFTRGIIATADGTKSIPIPTVEITPWQTEQPNTPVEAAPAAAASGAVSADVLAQRQKFLEELDMQARSARQPVSPEPAQTTPRWGLGRRKAQEKKEEPVIAPFNLAEQIDEILQAKLLAQGIATEMKIHSVPGGGIRIQVGREYFDTVDAVTDSAAQALIQAAISEWERR